VAPADLQRLLGEVQALQAAGRFDQALAKLAEVDRLEPGQPQARLVLGRILRDQNRPQDAIRVFQALAAEYPEQGEVLAELAVVTLQAGQENEAYALAKKGHELSPDSLLCLEYLGRVATGVKRWPVAISCFEQLVAKVPGVAGYYQLLANANNEVRRYDEAIAAYRKVLELGPLTFEHARAMARLLFSGRRFEEALVWHEKALAFDPGHVLSLIGLARSLIQLGRMEEGEKAARQALTVQPDAGQALMVLSELHPEGDFRESVALLEKNVAARGPKESREAYRDYLFLGKYYHDKKAFERAYPHFKTFNALRFEIMKAKGVVYDRKIMEENFRETKRIFTRAAIEKLRGRGNPSELPIFIVGMPRSGTTLLEQIVSTHPKVEGKGELSQMNWIFLTLNVLFNESPGRDIHELIAAEAPKWAESYLAALRAPPGTLRATDKMPVNFIHLGLINTLFPNARVIHIRRSPLDTCLSMYSNYFSDSYAYASRLEDLGHYYNLYAGLMAHWREALPMKFLEVQYEELVNATEAKAKAILGFCGLPWDAGVLEFYKGKKSAFTLSQIQVSKPINTSSFQRWKPYEKHIQPLIRSLDPAIVGPLDKTR
jgi:tetratricopeptide (TPR) repeat protein